MKRASILMALALGAGCAGPTAPESLTLAGDWRGTLTPTSCAPAPCGGPVPLVLYLRPDHSGSIAFGGAYLADVAGALTHDRLALAGSGDTEAAGRFEVRATVRPLGDTLAGEITITSADGQTIGAVSARKE